MDQQLTRILDELDAQGLTDNTVIVFTSDHGEMGGAHGLRGKGPFAYQEAIHLPLFVSHPDVRGGQNCKALTGHIDIVPTILSMCGVDPGKSSDLAGRDLPGKAFSPALNRPGASDLHAVRDSVLFTYSGIATNDSDLTRIVSEARSAGQDPKAAVKAAGYRSRTGGEAVKLTDYKASVSDLAWSPDSTRLALVVSDVDPDVPEQEEDAEKAGEQKKTPRPIVIDRVQFKRDGEGYLRHARSHVHVFDVKARRSVQVTSGDFDDSDPAWSPDGKWIAFSSNRTLPDPDLSQNTDIFVVPAEGGHVPRPATNSPRAEGSPVFSPDGKWIAYIASA